MPTCPKCGASVANPPGTLAATVAGTVLLLYCPACATFLSAVPMDR